MKIFIACSKHFYEKIEDIGKELEKLGHEISLPNSYDEPFKEEDMKKLGSEQHRKWKESMLKKNKDNIAPNEAVLVLNFEKNGEPNYLGGATFLETYHAWEMGKKIFLFNPIPENLLRDELLGFNPTIINGDLSLIK